MGRLLHLQRALGFADLLLVLHPERASLPRVLCSLTREPPRRLQVGELGGKRPVLRPEIGISRVKLLVLRFHSDIVRVRRAQLLIQLGDGPPHFRDEIKCCGHNAAPICKGAGKSPPKSHQKITGPPICS